MIQIPPDTYVPDEAAAIRLRQKLEQIPVIAVDTETTGLSRKECFTVFWSMSDGKDRWCLPGHTLPVFEKFLQDPERLLLFHNANFDTWMLANTGIDIMKNTPRNVSRRHCTMVAHTLFEDDAPAHTLKYAGPDVICTYNGEPKFDMPDFKDTFAPYMPGKKWSAKDTAKALLTAPIEVTSNYASHDAWVTYRLWEELYKRLSQIPASNFFAPLMGLPSGSYSLWDYYTMIEMPMLDVVYAMERHGMLIDPVSLEQADIDLSQAMYEIQVVLAKKCGKVINPNSPKQLQWLFFAKDGPHQVEPIKWTAGGASGNIQPSTDDEVLGKLVKMGIEDAKIIQEYRSLQKNHGTYVKGLLKRRWVDGRIRSEIKQDVTRTGRLSSKNPNLQNIPVRDKRFRFIRKAFIAPPGKKLLVADYAQLEARILAGLSLDKNMCDAILAGRDFHANTTALMFGASYDAIVGATYKKDHGLKMTEEEKDLLDLRSKGKTTGFGLLYGEGPRKLSQQLEVTLEEAKNLQSGYIKAYPGVRQFFDQMIEFTKHREEVTTLLGRKRNLPGINSQDRMAFSEACRQAQNCPIQGTAAEIVKQAQILLYRDDDIWSSGARMTMQVHDEVIMEGDEGIILDVDFQNRVKYIMEHPFAIEPLPLGDTGKFIPLIADPGTGDNWIDAK